MRAWLVLLLIALLPLRGWAGDAMAGQMMAHQLQAPATGHAQAQHGARHDCEGHGQAVPSSTAEAPADCPTCASCQACSAVALAFAGAALAHAVFSTPAPQAGDPRFASAEPLRALKPPIS